MSASLRTTEAQISPGGIVRPRTAPFHTVERELCFRLHGVLQPRRGTRIGSFDDQVEVGGGNGAPPELRDKEVKVCRLKRHEQVIGPISIFSILLSIAYVPEQEKPRLPRGFSQFA